MLHGSRKLLSTDGSIENFAAQLWMNLFQPTLFAVMAAARAAVILVALTSIMLTAVSSLAATPASSAVCGNLQGCHCQDIDKNKDR